MEAWKQEAFNADDIPYSRADTLAALERTLPMDAPKRYPAEVSFDLVELDRLDSIDALKPKELAPRYYVDERVVCIAVRDRTLDNLNDQGLHADTRGVVMFKMGADDGKGWYVPKSMRREFDKSCETLNQQDSLASGSTGKDGEQVAAEEPTESVDSVGSREEGATGQDQAE